MDLDLDPDPYWSPTSYSDPDPEKMNTDPQPWYNVQCTQAGFLPGPVNLKTDPSSNPSRSDIRFKACKPVFVIREMGVFMIDL